MSDPFIPPIDDYIAPSDSLTTADWQPDVPKERIEDESKQNAILASSYPIMAEVADWFDEQVQMLDSRTAVLRYAETYKIDPELAGRAFDVARDILESKASEYADYRSEKL